MSAGYTGDGLRAWKQTRSGRTYFLYDGTQPVCEMDGSGNVTATNTHSRFGLLARRAAGTSVLYAFDPRGNVVQRLNSSGTVLSTQTFDAFGRRVSTDSNTDPYAGFGGQAGYYTDWETGLALLTYRYYDSAAGKFLTRDPISYNGGINLYEYVQNSPTRLNDSLGLTPLGTILGAIGAWTAVWTCISGLIEGGFLNGETCNIGAVCNAVAACIGALVSAIVSTWVAVDAYAIPATIQGCISGFAGGLATSALEWICQELTCDRHVNLYCLGINVAASMVLGCITGAVFGSSSKEHIPDEEDIIRNRLGSLVGDLIGYDIGGICAVEHKGR